MSVWLLSFLLNMVYYIDWLKPTLCSCVNATQLRCILLFICCVFVSLLFCWGFLQLYSLGILVCSFSLSFKDCLFVFRGMGREREREGKKMCERNTDWLSVTRPQLGTWPATQACALTENWTSDLWVHTPVLNPLSHTSQGSIWFFL